ncbi:MFS transporter [Actinomadura barringtoniae]|uniref:MFS transporter n=1 Tax=Actinomadura barringtoniae TaxID=1427535 RepID=A0A939PN83_9ACTN|nr:MFS transporter [Actinomadura barringtoniae]MBO2455360.1 MFS transporter [Actinomadura barringtoniae]
MPELPRAVWVVLGADAVSAVGSGLTLPFLLVYLHRVRGLDIGWAGLAISAVALAGILGNPVGGYLADRIGARNALVCGLGVAAAGSAALAGVGSVGTAFAACGLLGVGVAMIWPSQDALLAELAGERQRSSVFAVRHATMNFGLAVGAASAGLLANASDPSSFVRLYLLDAFSFLVLVPVLLRFVGPAPVARERSGGGYRQVARDRAFRWVWVWALLMVAAGVAQFHAAFPAYATGEGGLSAGRLGVVYAANSVAVLVLQLPVLRLMEGRRRTRGMAVVCLCWAAAWAITLLAGGRLVLFALAMVVFAVGETFLAPTAAPLVNDLAPGELRGRYNGLYALAFTAGFVVGPAVCGLVFAVGADAAFLVGCAAVLCLAGAATPALERLLPANVNGDGADDA